MPDQATAPLSAEQLDDIAALLSPDQRPARADLIRALAEAVRDRRDHDHPTWEDLYCANLASWAGERTGAVLRRLLDAEAEIARLRAERDTLRDQRNGEARQADHWRDRYRQEANVRWDPTLPPGGSVCATCGDPVESEPCPEHHPRTAAARLRARVAELEQRLDAAAMTKVWHTAEGQKFVFVEDLGTALLGTAEAEMPETVTEWGVRDTSPDGGTWPCGGQRHAEAAAACLRNLGRNAKAVTHTVTYGPWQPVEDLDGGEDQ